MPPVAGDALVTFNYERHAVNCIKDHKPSKVRRLLACLPWVHQGRCSAPRIHGGVITVSRFVASPALVIVV